MKLFIQVEQSGETITARILALNDSYEPVVLDPRLLIGPNPVPEHPTGLPIPVSIEPALPREGENRILLNPWCLYGRERTFETLPRGRVTFHAYLLRELSSALLPDRPGDPDALFDAAEAAAIVIA